MDSYNKLYNYIMDLKNKFYNSKTGLINAKEFKKQNKITLPINEVKQFIQQQEVTQFF